jgi:hypothetical protein
MEFAIKVTNCVYLPILLREALEVRTRGKDIDERWGRIVNDKIKRRSNVWVTDAAHRLVEIRASLKYFHLEFLELGRPGVEFVLGDGVGGTSTTSVCVTPPETIVLVERVALSVSCCV